MVNRRGFLASIVHGIFGTITAVVGAILGSAVIWPSRAAEDDSWTDAGALANLVNGEPHEVAIRRDRKDGYYTATKRRVLYLVRAEDDVRAFSTTCTHLGCRVSWQDRDRRFKCPCHGGQYAIDGTVVAGPPPRGLDEVPIKVDGDRVFVRM